MDELVELGLRRPSAGTPAAAASESDGGLRAFLDSLLRILTAIPPDADPRELSEFRDKVKDFQARLSGSPHPQEVRSVAAACLKACEQLLRHSQQYQSTREVEVAELVAILREAARMAVGSSTEFNADLLARAENLSSLQELDDIRILKRELALAVASLQVAVQEKQQRDDEQFSELSQRVETLQASLIRAEEEASINPLTRVANRRSFDRALARMIKSARATHKHLVVAMLDIDFFKKINDAHGHPIGDRVLLCAAQWIGGGLRRSDFVARYGGEEFVCLMPEVTADEAEGRLVQVLAQIASKRFDYEENGESKAVRFTMSCGLTQLATNDTDQDFVQRADQALYDAKRRGRNRVVIKKRSMFGGILGK